MVHSVHVRKRSSGRIHFYEFRGGFMVHHKRAALYCRVSTVEYQDCARQEADLRAYAERCGYEVIGVYQEHASGAKNDRKERAKVMQLARQRKIDVILVAELSRWGRSTEDLLSTLQDLSNWNVSLIAQTGMQFDLASATGKLMVTMLAGFAEFERALTIERVKSGIANAKAKGVKFGRPETDDRKVLQLLEAGKSRREIAAALGISKTTVQKIAASR